MERICKDCPCKCEGEGDFRCIPEGTEVVNYTIAEECRRQGASVFMTPCRDYYYVPDYHSFDDVD